MKNKAFDPNRTHKLCLACKVLKPVSDFYANKRRADGKQTHCKDCQKRRKAEWYQKNKDQWLEHTRQYKIEHREHKLAKQREYNARVRGKQRQYYQVWYQKNRTAKLSQNAKWYQGDGRRQAKFQRRRARELNASGNGVTTEQWREIKRKYGNVCLCCGEQKQLTMDHVVPLSLGGAHDLSNIQPLCLTCNDSKGTKVIDYRKKQ